MEQEPKIEYGTTEMNEPKVESAPVSEPERSVENKLEGESGESLESRIGLNRNMLKSIAREMIFEAKKEFPEDIQPIIENMQKGKGISRGAQSRFDKARDNWWKERFGNLFSSSFMEAAQNRFEELRGAKHEMGELQNERSKNRVKKQREQMNSQIEKLQMQKCKKMAELHSSLGQLDNGKTIEKFRDPKRKILYYDGQAEKYYVTEESGQQYLDTGDILSDYAWKIRYAPDKNMPQHIFRQVAKRILVNEARRDIEMIYNKELAKARTGATIPLSISDIEARWKNPRSRNVWRGVIAEMMSREWLSRISLNQGLGFTVMRANSLEDGLYKIDFKLRTSRKTRGVIAGDNDSCEEFLEKIRKIGIQFTIRKKLRKKSMILEQAKKIFGEDIPVDDIVLVRISTSEFDKAFSKWLEAGKPSGGPEQFLSEALKARLLRETTRKLLHIDDERIEELIQ